MNLQELSQYAVEYKCRNCFEIFQKRFEKGTEADVSPECPHCLIEDSQKTGFAVRRII